MKSRFNEKLTFFLLVALALNMSSFRKISRNYTREFASSDVVSSDVDACFGSADGQSCSVGIESDSDENDGTGQGQIRITNLRDERGQKVADVEDGSVTWEKTTDADCGEECDLKGSGIASISKRQALTLQQIKELIRSTKSVAQRKANKNLVAAKKKKEKEEQLAEDKKQCKIDAKGHSIPDGDMNKKLACFQEQARNIEDPSDREEYERNYVAKYFAQTIEPFLARNLSMDPRVAGAMIEQLKRLNLGDAVNTSLNFLENVAAIKSTSINYQLASQSVFRNFAAALSSPDPKVRAAAKAQYDQQMGYLSATHFDDLLRSQNLMQKINMDATLSGSLYSDPLMASIFSTTLAQVNQNIGTMAASNPNMPQDVRNRFAQLANSSLGTSLPGINPLAGGLVNDPLTGALTGNTLGLGTGVMGVPGSGLTGGISGMGDTWNQAWNPNPPTGSNMATAPRTTTGQLPGTQAQQLAAQTPTKFRLKQ